MRGLHCPSQCDILEKRVQVLLLHVLVISMYFIGFRLLYLYKVTNSFTSDRAYYLDAVNFVIFGSMLCANYYQPVLRSVFSIRPQQIGDKVKL